MKYHKFPCILILPLLTLFYSNPVFPETTLNKMVIGDTSESIEISSDNGIEIDNKRNVVTFIGNVEAVKDDINIKCQRLELFYENLSGNNDSGGEGKAKILEIVAMEDVRISRPDGGIATAEKAVYNKKDEKVVLTGNPAVKQDTGLVEGCIITLFLKEEKFLVGSCGENKAKAVLKEEKR
jgi:lipopolysaccharide export system protein LptA